MGTVNTQQILKSHSMSNQPEKMEIHTLTSQIFFKLSLVVGIIKTRQSWQFELVTPSSSQEILKIGNPIFLNKSSSRKAIVL